MLISIVGINSNAQKNIFKAFKDPALYGAIAKSIQTIQSKRLANKTLQTNNFQSPSQRLMLQSCQFLETPKIEPIKVAPRSTHTSIYVPTLSRPSIQFLNPSKELLELQYDNAYYLIAKGDTIAGIKLLHSTAELGLKEAQYDYGLCCLNGEYVKKDIPTGNHFIHEAAKQNHPDALYLIGVSYYYGYEGYNLDTAESFKWIEKSAHEGSILGQVALGDLYYNAKDVTNAVKYWQMAITNNNGVVKDNEKCQLLHPAYLLLGCVHYNGELGYSDEVTAINYLEKATDCGNAAAAYILGLIYREKNEMQNNAEISCNYIRLSAMLGYADAQALYGYYRLVGYGTEKDSINAACWFEKAASSNNIETICSIPVLNYEAQDYDNTIFWGQRSECCDSAAIQYIVGAAYYNKEQYEEARIWWEKSAAQQLPDAMWWMYVLHSDITGDTITAYKFLEQACVLDFPNALCEMGYYYLDGYMVNRDIQRGRDLLQKAASMGYGLAYVNLGGSYAAKEYNGKQDWTTAAECYKKGAELNCPEAQYCYGYCLMKGKGVKKDKQEATKWFIAAARNGDEDAIQEIKKMKIKLY